VSYTVNTYVPYIHSSEKRKEFYLILIIIIQDTTKVQKYKHIFDAVHPDPEGWTSLTIYTSSSHRYTRSKGARGPLWHLNPRFGIGKKFS
jgi:hypothetical protein